MPEHIGAADESGLKNSSQILKSEELKQDLAGKSIRGGVSLVISELCCNVFRLAGTIALARLLTPEHFGLIGMVTALTAFAEMFKDFGLGTATIQQKEITHEQISTLFWINAGIGAIITLTLACAAPVIAWFYGDARLLWVAVAISSTFMFSGLGIQHQALLRRQMHFGQLASIQIIATGMSTILAIALAWLGFEYWALVWKEVSRVVIQVSATWLFSHWLPGVPTRGAGVRRMFQTGSHVAGFNVLAFASRSLDVVLIGKFWGPGPVGLYKQASQLLLLPVSLFSYPITYIMTPALSALQGDPDRYRNYYGTVLSLLAFGLMPLIVYMGVYSDLVVAILLGEKWVLSSPVLQVLALAASVEVLTATCGTVMITSGRTKAYLHIGVAQSASIALAIAVGTNWGMMGVAWAYVVYTYATLVPLTWLSFRKTPISLRLFFGSISLPAVSSLLMGIFLWIVRPYLESKNVFVELGLSVLVSLLLYCGVWMLFPSGRARLREYISQMRRIVDTLVSLVSRAPKLGRSPLA